MSIPFEIGNLSILGHDEPLVIADVRFWLPSHEIETANEVTVRVHFLLGSMASLEELNEAVLQEAKKNAPKCSWNCWREDSKRIN